MLSQPLDGIISDDHNRIEDCNRIWIFTDIPVVSSDYAYTLGFRKLEPKSVIMIHG